MRATRESGYTLVETMIAMVVFAAVSVGFYQVMFAQGRGADVTTKVAQIAEEARLGFNRMVRDTREGDVISAASSTSFTVKVNFNADGYYQNPNPQGDYEILTYTFDPAAKTISLNGEVLMANVENVDPSTDVFIYSSNFLDYDWDNNGVTTWQEVNDASCPINGYSGVGDCDNPPVLDAAEFPYLTTVDFAMKVRVGDETTDFYAAAHMRNRT